MDILRRLKEKEPHAVYVVISSHATVESAVAAMHAGAFDFIARSSQPEEIQFKLRKCLEVSDLRRSIQLFRAQEQREHSGEMLGESVAMQEVFTQIRDIATTRATTVLILGETGTGKELVARAIHRLSERRDKPLISVNCTAMPSNLMESEFFGYERGAFTGADRSKKGLLELADGGSLFLDEIGDLDLSLQGKLLRVIEERRFKRVGGVRDIDTDVRFMAATNRNLETMTDSGRFRLDLLYRLNVFQIVLPSLRERNGDILLLANHFIQKFNLQFNKQIKGLDEETKIAFLHYAFPGNVRQLRNLIEQAMIQAHGDWLTIKLFRDLSIPSGSKLSASSNNENLLDNTPFNQLLAEVYRREKLLWQEERVIIERALAQANGNKTQAAKLLGISRYALQRRLRREDFYYHGSFGDH
jgi:two-component system response regulator AtoC